MVKKSLYLIFLIALVALAFSAGTFFEAWRAKLCPAEEIDLSLFWQAWRILEEKFVAKEQLDQQKMIYGAIRGMVNSLEDPYTVFLNPEDTKKFLEDITGRFEGVGMEIGLRKGQLQVISPLEGTPAQKAGLRPGDKIIKINNTLTADITLEEAVNLIRGPKGTEVVLVILRDAWEKTKEFRIIRDVIEIPSLKWELRPDNIIYLKIYHFTEKARSNFAKIAFEILRSPGDRIILDLRNNPGGYLEVAQDIAGWFLKKGDVVAIEDFGETKKEYKARGNGEGLKYPLVILINQGSASGSEILAGALRDNRGIKLIGEKSFGKGSVQELTKLKDGSSLKVTVAKWLTPKGYLITDKGLEPDIEVKMEEEDYEAGRDPQLEKAIEVIKKI